MRRGSRLMPNAQAAGAAPCAPGVRFGDSPWKWGTKTTTDGRLHREQAGLPGRTEAFLANAREIGAPTAVCARHGLVGVFPADEEEACDPAMPLPERGLAISRAMERAMRVRRRDYIVNLTPTRGPSADVGSAYEMGFMRALGRPIFAYSTTPARSSTTAAFCGGKVRRADRGARGSGRHGNRATLHDNLMLAGSVAASSGCLITATVRPAERYTSLAVFERLRRTRGCHVAPRTAFPGGQPLHVSFGRPCFCAIAPRPQNASSRSGSAGCSRWGCCGTRAGGWPCVRRVTAGPPDWDGWNLRNRLSVAHRRLPRHRTNGSVSTPGRASTPTGGHTSLAGALPRLTLPDADPLPHSTCSRPVCIGDRAPAPPKPSRPPPSIRGLSTAADKPADAAFGT